MATRESPPEWRALAVELEGERRRAMAFLLDCLPESDLDSYSPELFLAFADHALALRRATPWCAGLNWELFAHYVLFPRVNDEDLSFHRAEFHAALWPRVRGLPSQEARVLEVNRWCHEHASYQAQDERTAAPLTVYRCGSGRCGEESAFLVSALRSVGIPARQVYAPRWSHCDDNHAWVEALCGGRWRYLGACEPEPALDRGWFSTAASRAVLVHSRLFGLGSSPLHGEPLGGEGGVFWFNQTSRYADDAPRVFRALAGGGPAAGAKFHLQVLNEAAFHTVAVLTADENGTARARLGRGSLHVLALWEGLTAEGDCGEEGVTLTLAPAREGGAPWTDFQFRAPTGGPAPAPLDGGQKAERAEMRRRGDALRRERMEGFSRPGAERWEDLRRLALGNWGEVAAFLNRPGEEGRERLVRTLAAKDLRDVTAAVLEDHVSHLPPQNGVPEELYWKYVACPRIGLERLTGWRGALARALAGWRGSPEELCRRLSAGTAEREAAYGGLHWPPEAALARGRCDRRSLRLLLIAALRTLGTPAHLRPLDGAPEYWAQGAFRPVEPEETGVLRLTGLSGEGPRYGQDWSLSRRTAEGWARLSPEARRRDGELVLTLPAGQYRLLTSVRLPGGDQLASRRELRVEAGGERRTELRLRAWSAKDLLVSQELPPVSAETLDGTRVPDLFRTGGPLLALWLEEGGEPTEHLLGELLARREALARLPAVPALLLRGRECAAQPTVARALAGLGGARALLDDWAYDLEALARHLGRDPDSPPLAVLCDGAGRAVYSACGYRVGAAELLLRAAGAAFGGAEEENFPP